MIKLSMIEIDEESKNKKKILDLVIDTEGDK